KLLTINLGKNLDQIRPHPEARHLFGIEEPLRGKPFELAAEKGLYRCDYALGIFRADADPDVHVLSRPNVAVVSDCMTTNQQIFNAVVVERLEELAKIGGQ